MEVETTVSLTLRSLRKSDFVLLHDWLNKPHLRPFYMLEAVSPDYVCKKFTPRVGERHATKSIIAEESGQPFGYMQWYLNSSYPEYGAATIGRTDGASIDYFIGDEEFLGRQLGSEMLKALVEQLLPSLETRDRIFHIGHDNENLRAIRCTTRAGFIADEGFVEKDIPSTLFVRDVSR